MKTQVDYEIELEAQREMFIVNNKLQLAKIFDKIDLDQDGYLECYEVRVNTLIIFNLNLKE